MMEREEKTMSRSPKFDSKHDQTNHVDSLPDAVPPCRISRWPGDIRKTLAEEQKKLLKLALPMSAMNLAGLAKFTMSTAFLGRLGKIHLAGGALAMTFANVTGFSVLTGLCSAMEPICGQAFGAENFKLLHQTLFMTFFLLLVASVPVSALWLNVEKILLCFGQDRAISNIAQTYLIYLLPDLLVTAFLFPLKAYLSSQSITLPVLVCSLLSVSFHVPINIFLSHYQGGVPAIALSICWTDLNMVTLLSMYAFSMSWRRDDDSPSGGRWWQCLRFRSVGNWVQLLRLCGPCCLMTCLEWWCYEMLVLLTGRLHDAQTAVSVLAIVLNADILLYAVMLSLAVSASTRVANELGANRPQAAYEAAAVAMLASLVLGCIGGSLLLCIRPVWGRVFSGDHGIVEGVKSMMVFMGALEVLNFPMTVSGGIVRGTAKPSWAVYANIGGFYFLALPLGAVLAFKVQLGLVGMFLGFLVGVGACALILMVMVVRIDWVGQAQRAQQLANSMSENKVEDDHDAEMSA